MSKLKIKSSKFKVNNRTLRHISEQVIKKSIQAYDPKVIEPKWQKSWLEEKIYEPDLDNARKPFYNLMMFPYPSAEGLHVGSFFTYGGIDAYGRFKRMQGFDVFEPIGLDGFGIHSENYAIKVGRTPQEHAKISEENFYRQLHLLGNAFDWSRKVETYDPAYYKWTQWLFVELFKAGLAYKAKATVNFCPSCKTVLSDEQVLQKNIPKPYVILNEVKDPLQYSTKILRGVYPETYRRAQNDNLSEISVGVCERCSTRVEKRNLEQWFFRITDYAERLLENTEKLDWTEKVKIAQKNWIGKKTGALVRFPLVLDSAKASLEQYSSSQVEKKTIEVFTTRPDTLYGATFLVVAPEHAIVEQILRYVQDDKKQEIEKYVNESSAKEAQVRLAVGNEKTGVFSGVYALNPVNNEKIPIWIAEYVLMDYGTGAIMAVPAHDERDFDFAKKYQLPIKQVIAPETGNKRSNEQQRDGGYAVIFDPQSQKYGISTYTDGNLRLYGGGVGNDEDQEKGVLREVSEESGLYDFAYVEKIKTHFAHFYNSRKKLNRSALATSYLVVLKSKEQRETKLDAHEVDMQLTWLSPAEILQNWEEWKIKENGDGGIDHWIDSLKQAVGRAIELGYDKINSPELFKHTAYTGEGKIIDSKSWDGWQTPESIDRVISWLEEKGSGKKSVNYHLRDWLISRQRYWGPPIPMIYCEKCAKEGKSWFTELSQPQTSPRPSPKWRGSNEEQKWNSAGWYPEENLPVLLPVVDDFKPLGTPLLPTQSGFEGQAGKAPLARHPEFYETTCPGCGGKATRETDVSDTFLDSSWYFFRYIGTEFDDMPFPLPPFRESDNSVNRIKSDSQRIGKTDKSDNLKLRLSDSSEISEIHQRTAKWLPVHSYIGGAEHAVLHLLYARFITMALKDYGYIDFEEPFTKFRANGLIIKNGAKMSKSKGNVISPDDYVRKYGADTLRTYLGFIGPFTQGGDFQDSGIEGINRFLKRVWNLVINGKWKFLRQAQNGSGGERSRTMENGKLPTQTEAMLHRTIKAVTEDMEELRFNTAIAKIMTYYNFLSDQEDISEEEIEVLLKLLAPFAPHMTEELWQGVAYGMWVVDNSSKEEATSYEPRATSFQSIHLSAWPVYDPEKIVSDTVTIAVQINGKLRDTIQAPSAQAENQTEIEKIVKERAKVKRHLEGKTVKKIIYVPGKIVNFVI